MDFYRLLENQLRYYCLGIEVYSHVVQQTIEIVKKDIY